MCEVYVVLIAECLNTATGEEKALSAHFKFANEELWNLYNDHQFDSLIEEFNQWLADNGYKDWDVDDVIETDHFINATDAINPVVVLK